MIIKRLQFYLLLLITLLAGNICIITAATLNYSYEVELVDLHASLLYLTLYSVVEIGLIWLFIEGSIYLLSRSIDRIEFWRPAHEKTHSAV